MKILNTYPLAFAVAGTASSALASTTGNFNLEHTAYSGGRGSRSVATMDAVWRLSEDTKAVLTVDGGRRFAGGRDSSAARLGTSVNHVWSDRLSTRTAAAFSSNGTIFARASLSQDLSFRVSDAVTGTIGGRYASWAGGDRVMTWSAGAGYYVRGLSMNYRFSLLDSSKLGTSRTHLASLGLLDGQGSTRLWLGAGTSLYEVDPLAARRPGSFRSVTLRREQKIAHGVELSAGLGRSWFNTAAGSYRGNSIMFGVRFVPASVKRASSIPESRSGQ